MASNKQQKNKWFYLLYGALKTNKKYCQGRNINREIKIYIFNIWYLIFWHGNTSRTIDFDISQNESEFVKLFSINRYILKNWLHLVL